MSSTSCRRASNLRPSENCRRSGWPRPRRMRSRRLGPLWQRKTNVWRRVTSPARGFRRQKNATEGPKMNQIAELRTQVVTRGRQLKFTPERIQQIKNLVERGKSGGEIAELVGVTVGSLRVTCSRLG